MSQYQPHIQESGSGDDDNNNGVGDVVDDAAIKGRWQIKHKLFIDIHIQESGLGDDDNNDGDVIDCEDEAEEDEKIGPASKSLVQPGMGKMAVLCGVVDVED